VSRSCVLSQLTAQFLFSWTAFPQNGPIFASRCSGTKYPPNHQPKYMAVANPGVRGATSGASAFNSARSKHAGPRELNARGYLTVIHTVVLYSLPPPLAAPPPLPRLCSLVWCSQGKKRKNILCSLQPGSMPSFAKSLRRAAHEEVGIRIL